MGELKDGNQDVAFIASSLLSPLLFCPWFFLPCSRGGGKRVDLAWFAFCVYGGVRSSRSSAYVSMYICIMSKTDQNS